MKETKKESAVKEGLASKENVAVKDMYKPHEKTQRMKKGTDRA